MYFGDWLRSAEVLNSWYLSYRSEDPSFAKKLNEFLGRNSQIQKLSSTCLLLETTESKKPIVKKLRKFISPADELVFLFRHQRMVAYEIIKPAADESS